MIQAPIEIVEINHAHLYCGLGGGAKGFNRGKASVGPMRARFRCLGGIDVSPAAIRDFERLAGVPGTCMDLMDREQYLAFHGQEPPAGWREAMPEDIRRAFRHKHPRIPFHQVIRDYGWPIASKKIARGVNILRNPTERNKNIWRLRDPA